MALALVVVGAAGGLVAYQRSAQRVSVLAVARPLSQGQVIQAGDLQVVRITPASGMASVTSDAEASVIGHHAAVPLASGQLLVPADLASHGTTLGAGEVEIGAALGLTQVPAEGVSAGEVVEAVFSPTSASAAGDKNLPGSILATATVMGVAHPASGSSGAELVSLSVPASQETGVEAATAASQLGLVPVSMPGAGK